MALSDSHFKAAVIPKGHAGSTELPMDLIAVGGGVIMVFVIVLFVAWKWINREDVPGG